jgi:hypothetical protein
MLVTMFGLGVAIALTLSTLAQVFAYSRLLFVAIVATGVVSFTPAGHSVWVDVFNDDENLAIAVRLLFGLALLIGFGVGTFG